MPTLTPQPSESKAAGLDRPQRLGFLPTTAFWQRPDVWKVAGRPTGAFVFLWMMMLSLCVVKWTPMWASALLAGLGPFLFVAVLERYLRARLRQRRSLTRDESPGALGSRDESGESESSAGSGRGS